MDNLPQNAQPLFCVKMRASSGGSHVSGAERIREAVQIPAVAAELAARALSHEKGVPDDIRIKIEPSGEIVRIPALPVSTEKVETAAEGMKRAAQLLALDGISRVPEIMEMFSLTHGMRGAMLLDADTLERLEPDRERGIRATRMDAALDDFLPSPVSAKNHFAEAIVLASKVQAAPGIVAEICVSDDPGYVTGYVASKNLGYRRITVMKESGDPRGGRIFLFRGPRELVPETISFLQERTVLVEGAPSSAPTAKRSCKMDSIEAELENLEEAGLRRSIVECEGPAGPRVQIGGREIVVLASNDYCDLARDPRVVAASSEAAFQWGAGTGGSRLITGTQTPHLRLERHLAAFKGTEAAVVFSSGFMANMGVVSALCGSGDVIFSDELNHASIIDGCRLSKANVVVYPHNDFDALEKNLKRAASARRRLVVSDGVFSMDGDIVDLPRLVSLCRQYDAFSMIDEAHSTGVIGRSGCGLCEHFGCEKPDILMGTMSKALGSSGGYICCSSLLAQFVLNKARSFIFSTSLPASAMAAADAALSILESEPERAEAARGNARFLVEELGKRGVCASTQSAIVPIPVGDEDAAVLASRRLMQLGFWIPAVRYPTVARGSARLRASTCSAHTKAELAAAAAAVASVLK